MKKLPVILVFILMFSSVFTVFAESPPTNPQMVSGPYLKYDTNLQTEDNFITSMNRIPNSEYVFVVYADSGSGMTLATLRVWNTNGTVQNKVTSSWCYGGTPQWLDVCHVSGTGGASGDIYVVYSPEDNWMKTVRVWGTNGTVQPSILDTQAPGSATGGYYLLNITKIAPNENVYAIGAGGRYLETYTIDNTTGDISARVDVEDVIGSSKAAWSLIMADSDTIIVSCRDYLKTYNISATGDITGTGLGRSTYTGPLTCAHSIVRQNSTGSDVYVDVFWDLNDDCVRANTYRIWGNGTIQQAVLDTEVLDVAGNGHSVKAWPMGANEFVTTYHERVDGHWIAKFFNVSNTGVITAAFKTFDSAKGDITNIDMSVPVTYMENNLFTLLGYDNDETLNFYTFWRNATHAAIPTWKTAATWNGTFYNDTLYQQIPWNGTLFGFSAWLSIEWNGTLWNNSRAWRTTRLYERFNPTQNSNYYANNTIWRAQSFTVGSSGLNIDFWISKLRLNLFRNTGGTPGTGTVLIYAADANHRPTGAILSTGTFDGNILGQGSTNAAWVEFSMTTLKLTAGSKYVIVMKGSNTQSIYWTNCKNSTVPGSASYGGGYHLYYTGGTWLLSTSVDNLFCVWGLYSSTEPSYWNGTLYNTTISWKETFDGNWNGTFWNLSYWNIPGLWNGTLWNTSGFSAITWNGTLYNDTLFQAITWNGTLWNKTYWIPEWFKNPSTGLWELGWNGTLKGWPTEIAIWNGTLIGHQTWQPFTWNGTLFNMTWMPTYHTGESEWNGTLYNDTVFILTIHIIGYGVVQYDPDPMYPVAHPRGYHWGDVVNLLAIPAQAFPTTFTGWGVDAAPSGTTNPTTILMDGHKTINATFYTSSHGGFTYNTTDTNNPDITDVINTDTDTFQWSRIFTYVWVWLLGGWFFALVLGIIGGAIYLSFKNLYGTMAYYIVILLLFAAVAQNIGYIVGIAVALLIGFLFYRLLGGGKKGGGLNG